MAAKKAHYLAGWKVNLPVNAKGKPTGKAVMNWPASKRKPPWYRLTLGGSIICKVPEKGALTPSTSSPRCELSQTKAWSKGKISYKVKVSKCEENFVILQCRAAYKDHELIQVKLNGDMGTFSVWMNEGGNKFRDMPYPFGQTIEVSAEVERGKDIKVTVNGQVFEVPMKHSYKASAFNWKFGGYGEGEAKFSKLKVS